MHEHRARTNRLRRSVRASQAADRLLSPGDRPGQAPLQHDHQSPVQTQTLVQSRLSTGATAESSLNESGSDLHQDIIWDNSSPSAQRSGKRGRRLAPVVVNISDIVSRIAPESGRPRVLEPTLQQWIGDSATIPCTPELQPPKAKKKLPRPNRVDDLLRLAKQFDFNMLCETHPGHDLNQDLDQDFDLPTTQNPNLEPDMDWISDEDLDYLFERSTQSASGAFSQSLPTPKTAQTKTQAVVSSKASGNILDTNQTENTIKTSQTSFSSVQVEQFSPRFHNSLLPQVKLMDTIAQKHSSNHSSSKSKQNQTKTFKFKLSNTSHSVGSFPKLAKSPAPVPDNDFDDDWGKDDLMDDSLLMEMTQNPLGFTSPKCTSTQRNSDKIDRARQTFSLTTPSDLSTKQGADFDDFSEISEISLDRKSKTIQNLPKTTSQFAKHSTLLQMAFSDHSIGAKQNSSNKQQSFLHPQSDCTTRPQEFSQNFAENSSVGFQSSSASSKNGPNLSSVNGLRTRSRELFANESKNDTFATVSGTSCGKGDFSNNFGTKLQQRFGAKVVQTGFSSKVIQNVSPAIGFGTRSEAFSANNINSASNSSKDSGKRLQQCFRVNISSTVSDCKSSQVSSGSSFGSRSGGFLMNDIKIRPISEKTDFKTGQSISSGNGFGAKTEACPSQNSKSHTSHAKNEPNFVDRGKSLWNASKDLAEEDLDSIFSSEPLWDDDDDLLCEICDDVETQMQSSTNHMQWRCEKSGIEKMTNPMPTFDLGTNGTQRGGQRHSESALLNQGTNQTTGQRTNQPWTRSKAPPQKLTLQCEARDDFTFKRPNPVSARSPRVTSKCSAAEIELKKQQAMERRRQRLLTSGNQPISSQRNHTQPISSQRNHNQPISSQRNHNQPISSLRAPT